MPTVDDFGDYETAWCPGCGNFMILKAVKQGLADAGIAPHEALFVSGIGQAAKAPHYLNCNVFTGLHGRAMPAATGAKLTNPDLHVICESGDGCNFGEGGNHFLAAIRRNIGVTMLAHDNRVYGLTKGQASPTTTKGFTTKAQPTGSPWQAFNPVQTAISMRANFVARAFAAEQDQLAKLLGQALEHPGFALIDVCQPCPSFNDLNTFEWFKQHTYTPEDHDPDDWDAAMQISEDIEEKIALGLLYRNNRPAFEENFPWLKDGPLFEQPVDTDALQEVMQSYA